MKKRTVGIVIGCVLFLTIGSVRAWAETLLAEWAFNDNGSVYDSYYKSPGDLPGYFNGSHFDWDTGLGTLTVSYNQPGDFSFIAFFDHEIVRAQNTYYNEWGTVSGTPGSGQSWEIDEPGWVYGDIYDNMVAGTLDDTNSIPPGTEDDVSMAMGWNFSLDANDTALITLTVSDSVPTGFYLGQHDPDGSIYFSGRLSVIHPSTSPVSEPAPFLLLGLGFLCLAGVHIKRSSRKPV